MKYADAYEIADAMKYAAAYENLFYFTFCFSRKFHNPKDYFIFFARKIFHQALVSKSLMSIRTIYREVLTER